MAVASWCNNQMVWYNGPDPITEFLEAQPGPFMAGCRITCASLLSVAEAQQGGMDFSKL